jgi:hypothetical protein
MSVKIEFSQDPSILFDVSGVFFDVDAATKKSKIEIDKNDNLDTRLDKWEIRYDTKCSLYGSAIFYTRIDADGKMWVGNFEYESQVNYCPITGRNADVLIDQPNIEEQ